MYRYLYLAKACLWLALGACAPAKTSAGPKVALGGGPTGPETTLAARDKFQKAIDQMAAMEKEGTVDLAALKPQFVAALKDDSKFTEAYYNLGVIAEAQGKLDEALTQYDNALKTNGKYAPAIENKAGVLVQQGKIDDAMRALEEFVKAEPSEPRPRVALATIYRDKKRYDEALEQCRAALQREPKNLLAFETMSGTYADLGNVPMSRLVAARGLKVDAKDAPIHHVLGRHLLNENKIPEAVLEFKQALDSNPRYRPARVDIAEVSLSYRDFGNAKVHYAELLADAPNDVPALIGLGISNKGLGLADDAKAAYEKVLQLEPKNAIALLDLAILQHRTLNDFAGALKSYKAYQENPVADGPKPEEIKANIAELEATIEALKQAEEH